MFDSHVNDYKMKTITRNDGEVVTFRDMHSLSVGDIVAEKTVDGTRYHQVAGMGYVEVFPAESTLLYKDIKQAS